MTRPLELPESAPTPDAVTLTPEAVAAIRQRADSLSADWVSDSDIPALCDALEAAWERERKLREALEEIERLCVKTHDTVYVDEIYETARAALTQAGKAP